MDSQFPQIAKWFNTVDKDRSGRLTSDQLQEALRNNNYTTFDPAIVELLVTKFCHDNSRTINLNEFCELWKYLNEWRKTFDRFDVSRSGNITKEELKEALITMGYVFSPQFPNLVMQKFDYRRSGTLQFDGFVHAVIMIQRMTVAFQPNDTQRNGNANFTLENFLATVFDGLLGSQISFQFGNKYQRQF